MPDGRKEGLVKTFNLVIELMLGLIDICGTYKEKIELVKVV